MASSKTTLFLIVCVLFAFVLLVSSRATPDDVRTNQDGGTYGEDPPAYGSPSIPTYGPPSIPTYGPPKP
ncbi:hypothetical protein QYF36_021806 [Acer negundo]|nr:hypothetical protein QYF36_021806 [Acer negundo]